VRITMGQIQAGAGWNSVTDAMLSHWDVRQCPDCNQEIRD
jgi:hypothetical protein